MSRKKKTKIVPVISQELENYANLVYDNLVTLADEAKNEDPNIDIIEVYLKIVYLYKISIGDPYVYRTNIKSFRQQLYTLYVDACSNLGLSTNEITNKFGAMQKQLSKEDMEKEIDKYIGGLCTINKVSHDTIESFTYTKVPSVTNVSIKAENATITTTTASKPITIKMEPPKDDSLIHIYENQPIHYRLFTEIEKVIKDTFGDFYKISELPHDTVKNIFNNTIGTGKNTTEIDLLYIIADKINERNNVGCYIGVKNIDNLLHYYVYPIGTTYLNNISNDIFNNFNVWLPNIVAKVKDYITFDSAIIDSTSLLGDIKNIKEAAKQYNMK